MNSDRREFFKKMALAAVTATVLPRMLSSASANTGITSGAVAAAANHTGPFKVHYTFKAESVEDGATFRQLMKTCGVKTHNLTMQSEGHILSKSEFYYLPDGSMRSDIIFKSKESYERFLQTSKTVSAELLEFKKKKNIQIAISAAA